MAQPAPQSGPEVPAPTWGTKAALLCMGPLAAYVFGGLVPVLPHIREAFAGTPGAGPMVRFLVSGLGISMIIGAPLAGLAAARFGLKRVLLFSLVVYAVLGTVDGLLNNLWAIIVVRLLFGLGAAGCGTLLVALVADMPDAQRNRWLGISTAVGTAASFVLIPLAGYLGAMNWRYPFFVHAAAVIAIVFVMIGVRSDASGPGAAKVRNGAEPAARRAWPIVMVAIAVVAGMLTSALQLFAPFHLNDIGEHNPARIGILIMMSSVATGVSSSFYGPIRRRLSMRGAFAVAFSMMAAGWAISALSTNAPVFVVGMLIGGIGTGVLMPHFFALAAVTGPPHEAPRNVGLARGCYYAGPLASQILLEPFVEATSAGMAMLALAGLGVVAAVVVGRIHVPYYGSSKPEAA